MATGTTARDEQERQATLTKDDDDDDDDCGDGDVGGDAPVADFAFQCIIICGCVCVGKRVLAAGILLQSVRGDH